MANYKAISYHTDITSGPRSIRNGFEFDKYFPKPEERDRAINKDGKRTGHGWPDGEGGAQVFGRHFAYCSNAEESLY